MDLLKEYLNKNSILTIETGGDFHVIKITNTYVILKNSYRKHEFKYYFDTDETDELLLCDALHRLPNTEEYNQGIKIDFDINIFKTDIFKQNNQSIDKKVKIMDSLLKLNKKYKFKNYTGILDTNNLIDEDCIHLTDIVKDAIDNNKSLKQSFIDFETKNKSD